MAKHATPLLDQLESGPWPSFVSDLKQEAANRAKNPNNVEFQVAQDCVEDLLGVLELSWLVQTRTCGLYRITRRGFQLFAVLRLIGLREISDQGGT